MSISRWIIVDENGGFIVCCIYWDRKAYVYEGGDDMKRKFIWAMFWIGLILGTLLVNTQLNVQEILGQTGIQTEKQELIALICKRIVELVAVVAFLKLVPDKASDGALMGISGLITGMMVSLYGLNGTMFRAFAFYMIVLIIVGLYAVVVKIICGTTGEGMSQIACIVARLHNSFLGTAIIVTILSVSYTHLRAHET